MRRIGVALLLVGALATGACGESVAASEETPTTSNRNRVTQSYWYCWNDGHGGPHHLGYHVSGDHLCTDGELGR